MQKNKSLKYTAKTIGFITMIGLFFLGWNFAQTIDPTALIRGIDIIEDKTTDREKFEEMVNHFCESLDSYDKYNSSESLFVYNICKDSGKIDFKNKGLSEDPDSSYIKFTEDPDGNLVNTLNQSLPGFYSNTEKYIQNLFDSIIGSYTSIYQANIYGYSNNPDKAIEELIHENFAQKHFITNPKAPIEYIQICATDKPYNYPKTCKKLKEYFYGAKNLVNANTENYLNDENIYKSLPKNGDGIKCENNGDNIVSCGLYGGEIEYFTNLVYNELLFYALFMDYYSYLLQNKSDFKNLDTKDFQKKLSKNEERIQIMTNSLENSRTAIKTTIKILKEIQYSFPIHIGFLLYSEDIYKFTSSMNKTLTPIYTLYDIFRNVQNPE